MNLSLFMGGVMDQVREWFSGFFGAVLSIIPKLLYFLCTLIFQILDILQILVRKVAGLDVVYYDTGISGGGGWQDGDIVFKFIQTIFNGENSILSNVFWAFIILGVIMLIITTFVAVLRSEYAATDAKSASKGKIVGKAFKAIASFAIVPIVCFFGVFLANVILQALDAVTTQDSAEIATEIVIEEDGEKKTISVSQYFMEHEVESSKIFENAKTKTEKSYTAYCLYGETHIPTTTTPISGLIFKAAASQANRIRYYEDFRQALDNDKSRENKVGADVFHLFGGDYDSAANLLDEAFARAYKLKNQATLTTEPFEKGHMFPFGTEGSIISNTGQTFEVFDKNNVNLVWYYYDLWSFNFIIGIGALVICAMLLIYLVFGLMKRIFELLALFLIAPPITALMPLDDGAALKKWREKFTSKVIGAYAPVVGLNLFFIILPFINSIRFFGIYAIDAIVNMFFVIVGLIMVKDLVGTIAELIGADNSLKAGTEMAGEVGGTIAKIGKVAAAPIGLGVKAIKGGVKVGQAINNRRKQNRLEKEMDKQQMADLEATDPVRASALKDVGWRNRRKILRGMRDEMSAEDKADLQNRATYALGSKDAKRHGFMHYRRHSSFAKAARKQNKRKSLEEKIEETMGAAELYESLNPGAKWSSLKSSQKEKYKQEYQINKRGSKDFYETNKDLRSKKSKNLTRIADIEKILAREDDLSEEAKRRGGDFETKSIETLNNLKAEKARLVAHNSEIDDYLRINDSKMAYNRVVHGYNDDYSKHERSAAQMASLSQKGGMLKKQDALETGKEIGEGIVKALGVDQLGPIFSMLGANLAKGFKDAGGFGEIKHRIQGLSAKEVKIQERFKEQKGLLAAQDSASNALGRGGGGPSQTNISDESIRKLAQEIVNATRR